VGPVFQKFSVLRKSATWREVPVATRSLAHRHPKSRRQHRPREVQPTLKFSKFFQRHLCCHSFLFAASIHLVASILAQSKVFASFATSFLLPQFSFGSIIFSMRRAILDLGRRFYRTPCFADTLSGFARTASAVTPHRPFRPFSTFVSGPRIALSLEVLLVFV